ncbi:MAG: glycosyltransferase, partial [Treponema sp.]|nr:glycosyltransferase [Treponema sp.]
SPFPFFEKCDLFVYPTLYDAWGNVITEALHCGCPVFASNSSGPSYILQHNELLFNIGSSEEIAEKIKNCIIDNDYYHKIRYLCAERSGQLYFNWAEMFEKAMIEYLNENEISK